MTWVELFLLPVNDHFLRFLSAIDFWCVCGLGLLLVVRLLARRIGTILERHAREDDWF